MAQRKAIVNIYEQFKELLGPVGAGIGLNGGALCLSKLGYRHVWEDVAEQIHHVNQVSPSGNISRMFPLDLLKNTPMEGHFICARRDLFIRNLFKAMEENPDVNIHIGEKAVNFDQTKDEALVSFESGIKDSAEVIVCADGIHSAGIDYIIRDEELAAAKHTGHCVYYGIIPDIGRDMPDKTGYEIDVGGGCTIMTMPLPNREAMIAVCHPGNDDWHSDCRKWSFKVHDGELHEVFTEHDFYNRQSIITPEMVMNTYRLLHLGVFEKQDLPKWHKGRICMIGDACHAMSPFLGQGANQAIQDAYLLAEFLDEMPYEQAFQAFYDVRHPTVKRLVMASDGFGYLRIVDSFFGNIARNVMRAGTKYAPDKLLQLMLMKTMAPNFL
ncbi:Oidioi.mRNA.OKI2018_I69.PAR.g12740.t1.cds [Oikopleura dioica]|uniref:Oidioi.mRNA.OKI2018_I69.PAR.g12740.t1.cds n=1 Tax=Oikopleura dioica TaxID=34765 RepID=A0ABN7S4Y6_OIKDI|nr:Oidioi.mRNA.OKI2018_I69.PAR.g12740.t1.cds [Oikopleura dioica]